MTDDLIGEDGELLIEDPKPRKQKRANRAALFVILLILGGFAVALGVVIGARTTPAPAPTAKAAGR